MINTAVLNSQILPRRTSINCGGRLIRFDKTIVMGILNITPDSFYKGSRYNTPDALLHSATQMLVAGAEILDIGAYSSRPGAEDISPKKEWERLEPALDSIRTKFPDAIISLDTFRAEIAQKAVYQYDVNIINDISAGNNDPEMFPAIASLRIPYILMHMQGTPQNMQQHTQYTDIMQQIVGYFAKKIQQLRALGVHDLIIDPGFGFSKTVEQNYHILSKLTELSIFEEPILVGMSRKSMIYKTLNTSPEESLSGTIVLQTLAIQKGASIIRTHDVKQTTESIKLIQKLESCK
ncbi:MAG: putative dihydropteroate synthase [Bacteroidota bacterium]|jgi:dihydropteroate synthase